jgi:LEA14-like dessication related protein
MKQFSIRNLLFLVVVVAQPFVASGCMEKFRAADKQVEAMDKRMKQIEKDASNVHSKRGSESK